MANMYMGRNNSPLGFSAPSAPPKYPNPLPPPIQGAPSPIQQPTPLSNTLGPTAVRPEGPSQGFDPAFLQNLASAFGNLFANPSGGNLMQFNPLGSLQEISPSSGIGGNAPTQGLPQTWLQKALGGGGFSYVPPTTAGTTNTPQNNPIQGGVGGTTLNGRPRSVAY